MVKISLVNRCFSFILFVCSLASCEINENEPDAQIVMRFVNTSQQINETLVNSITQVNVICNQDSQYSNLPYSFNEAYEKINMFFSEVDTIKSNQETKQYIKALILADFVFGSCGHPLLGKSLGMSNSTLEANGLVRTTLVDVYSKTNSNTVAIDCGTYSTYYKYLLDSLLGLSSSVLSIEKLHTFPVITIGTKEYLIDPSDPFVLLNSDKSSMLSFDELKVANSLFIFRSRRVFGNSQILVSRELVNHLNLSDSSFCFSFSDKLNDYLEYNNSFIQEILKRRNSFYYETDYSVFPLDSKYFSYKIDNTIGILSCKLNLKSLQSIYLGQKNSITVN